MRLLLRKHTDLKIEMRAPLGLVSHAILADEDADGKEDTFRGDKKRQNAKRERIKRLHLRDQAQIHNAPDSDQDYLEHKKLYTADKFYDGIAVALGGRAAIQCFFFQLGNSRNIELRRIFRDLIR